MRTDMSAQVRVYAEHLESLVDVWEIEDVVAEPISPPIPARRHQSNWGRGVLVAVGVAAVIVVVGLAASLLFSGSETSGPVATPVDQTSTSLATTVADSAEPTEIFSWGGGDLSRWVTEDEMTELLEGLSKRYYEDYALGDLGGMAVLARPSPSGDYVWAVGYWSVGVHAGGGYHPTPTDTDPRLPDGVKYFAAPPSYGLTGPNSSSAICLTVTTPGTTGGPENEPNYESIVFEIGTMMLREMGWVER